MYRYCYIMASVLTFSSSFFFLRCSKSFHKGFKFSISGPPPKKNKPNKTKNKNKWRTLTWEILFIAHDVYQISCTKKHRHLIINMSYLCFLFHCPSKRVTISREPPAQIRWQSARLPQSKAGGGFSSPPFHVVKLSVHCKG